MSWNNYESVEYYIPIYKKRKNYKFAIFDLDGTLITRSNARNPKYPLKEDDKWEYLGDIIEKFRDLRENKWTIVIVTNQSRFNQIVFNQIESVRKDVEEKLGWSPFIFISKMKDRYRKPDIGTINLLFNFLNITNFNEKIKNQNLELIKKINIETKNKESFLKDAFVCGDAIGKEDPYPPYQWSNIDLKFAENLGFDFIRPIDFFQSNKKEIMEKVKDFQMIIMIGNQGSGKSTFAKKLAKKYDFIVLEKDVLKTKIKKSVLENIKIGNKIIIDGTHSSQKSRDEWIEISKEYGLKYAFVWIIRQGISFNEQRETKIPDIALNIYTKNFEEPDNQLVFKVW